MKWQIGDGGALWHRSDNRTENRTQEPTKGRSIRLAVRVFLLVLIQVCVVGRFGFFGGIPDILLAHLVVLAVTGQNANRWKTVSVLGIVSGFLADVLGGVGVGFLALFYFLVGAFASNLMRRTFCGISEELLCFYAVLCPAAILRSGVSLLGTLIAGQSGFSIGLWALHELLPAFLGTLLFGFPLFFLFRRRI